MTAVLPESGLALTTDRLVADVRGRLFAGMSGAPWRVGAEIELLALGADDLRPVPLEPDETGVALLPAMRRLAREQGWREGLSPYGVPAFTAPGIGVISFEPGGQIEVSTVPLASPSMLLAVMRDAVATLRRALRPAGIELLEIGLDPANDVSSVPLQLHARRYTRMAAHFDRIGPDGARMMRQTASCQLSIDVSPADALRCWTVFNAMAPALIAAFANSPFLGGERANDASARARCWQRCDPSRTGIFEAGDGVEAYAEFALAASAFLLNDGGAPARPFGEALQAAQVSLRLWEEHLSTLFPEIRPRGYLEVRACDMVGDDARAALLLSLCAVARDPNVRETIAEIVGPPDRDRYARAPSGDPALLSQFADVMGAALASARREARGVWSPEDVERAQRFTDEYPRCGRTPADDIIAQRSRFARMGYS